MTDTKEVTAEYKFTGDVDSNQTIVVHNGTTRKNKVVVELKAPGSEDLAITVEARQLFLVSHLISGAVSSGRDIEAEIKGDKGDIVKVSYKVNPGRSDKTLLVGGVEVATDSEAQDIATLFYMAPEVLAQ